MEVDVTPTLIISGSALSPLKYWSSKQHRAQEENKTKTSRTQIPIDTQCAGRAPVQVTGAINNKANLSSYLTQSIMTQTTRKYQQ